MVLRVRVVGVGLLVLGAGVLLLLLRVML